MLVIDINTLSQHIPKKNMDEMNSLLDTANDAGMFLSKSYEKFLSYKMTIFKIDII